MRGDDSLDYRESRRDHFGMEWSGDGMRECSGAHDLGHVDIRPCKQCGDLAGTRILTLFPAFRSLSVLLVVAFACGLPRQDGSRARPQQQRMVRLLTGAPIVSVYGGRKMLVVESGEAFLQSESKRRVTRFYSPITQLPITNANVLAGSEIMLGNRQIGWAIVGDRERRYVYIPDANGDGDLRNDVAIPMSMGPYGRWRTTAQLAGSTSSGYRTIVAFEIELSERGTVYVTFGTERHAYLDAPKGPMRVSVWGVWGYYGMPTQQIQFDLDRDGNLHLGSVETVHIREGAVSIDDVSFEFDVSPDGSVVSLWPSKKTRPKEAAEGSRISGSLETLSGDVIRIEQLSRNDFVLLDFWSLSCAPCLENIPKLEELSRSGRPVRIIGITPDTVELLGRSNVVSTISWPIYSEDFDGRFHTLFKISSYPTFVLIEPGGRVRCLGCDLESVIRIVDGYNR